jgi:type I restriction enzyme S subunit
VRNELPEGWAEAPLPELFEINPPKPRQDLLPPGTTVTFVPMGAVDAERGAITAPEVRSFADVRAGYTGFIEGDVIMAKITPCFENGKAAIARNLQNGLGFGSSEFHIFRARGAVLPEYLFHFLRQPAFREASVHHMTGTAGQARVPARYLRELVLPVPPLREQRRIVAKVEAVLDQVNRVQARLARVQAVLKRFRQAVLAAACSGRLSEDWRLRGVGVDTGWPISALEDVCSVIADCPHSTPKWTERGEICIRTTNFNIRGLDLSEVRYVSEQTYKQRIARLEPKPGDLVYSREGGILGIACIIPPGLRACLGQRMILFHPDPAKVCPEFLCHLLNSPATLDVVKNLTGGTASPHLNVADIRKFEVPLPSLAEQGVIVPRVHGLLVLADAVERRLTLASSRAENLPQSILAKALSGELVRIEAELARTEGRDYEPADALLERVRKEGEMASRRTTWRRRRRNGPSS